MKRLAALTLVLIVAPATAAAGAELDELLSEGSEASYSAEQVISCSTPDGVRNALVRIEQTGNELTLSSSVTDDVQVRTGSGGWTLTREDGLVAQANVDAEDVSADVLYTVEDGDAVEYLGRAAMAYMLIRDGEPRAELIVDDETGAIVEAVTLTIEDEIYCERRFVSLDTATPAIEEDTPEPDSSSLTLVESSSLPEEVEGFELLDQYEDEEGVLFAYYSDGFFSFALFETLAPVALPNSTRVEFDSGEYRRVFTAGQVTYVWETRDSGMALVGDLPPDMHEAVLAEMPQSEDPGLFRRWWRALFG